jgi:predicted Zn finger-like uncharacterized protein
MTFATRCTACGTIFRVVQDQLRVSDGWVRCGRCEEVFNAQRNLFDLEREAPPPWPAAPRAQPARSEGWPSTLQPDAAREMAEVGASDAAADDAGLAAQPLLRHASADVAYAPPPWPDDDDGSVRLRVGGGHESPGPPAQALARAPRDRTAPARPPGWPPTDEAGSAAAPAVPTLPTSDEPAFVRAADRAQRWRRPGVRLGLAAAAMVLALLLAAQLGWAWRNAVAAHWPATRPLLQALCRPPGCRIEPPRQLDALAVDSSTLTQLGTPGLYRLSVVLRNRAAIAVRLPAVELALTDAQGQVVARKALLPQDFAPAADSVPATGELPLQTVLAAAERKPVGYSVEIFYP